MYGGTTDTCIKSRGKHNKIVKNSFVTQLNKTFLIEFILSTLNNVNSKHHKKYEKKKCGDDSNRQ